MYSFKLFALLSVAAVANAATLAATACDPSGKFHFLMGCGLSIASGTLSTVKSCAALGKFAGKTTLTSEEQTELASDIVECSLEATILGVSIRCSQRIAKDAVSLKPKFDVKSYAAEEYLAIQSSFCYLTMLELPAQLHRPVTCAESPCGVIIAPPKLPRPIRRLILEGVNPGPRHCVDLL
ncbi:hypothetical protein BDQ17DRAFT_1327378 [Cyathus striatus]|nr:hypothetical protein BDQ17DRAFT_1327378 [Cyathus striatus]